MGAPQKLFELYCIESFVGIAVASPVVTAADAAPPFSI